jgi:peptide/nickel transport system substrate-binding protein
MRRLFPSIALGIVLLMLVAACGGGSAAPQAGGTMNVRILLDPGSIDPHKATSTSQLGFANYVYDKLVANVAGKIQPFLASKWDIKPDTATLTIRNDVTCSDGSKLKASDVAANFDRLKDPATKSPYTSTNLGSTTYTVTADDSANTVTIKLPKPFGDLLTGLTNISIVCASGLLDPSKLANQTFGTGPYVLKDVVAGDHYTLTKRKGYHWGPGGTTNDNGPDTLVVKVVNNETTAANELLSGGLDIVDIVGAERDRLDANQGLFKVEIYAEVFSVFFNHKDGRPGADPAVRKALAQAVNRDDLAKAINGKHGKVATSLLLPQSPCQDPTMSQSITSYDAAAAKQTLAGAGYTTGSDGKLSKNGQPLIINLLIPDLFPGASDYLLDAWGTKLGVKVNSQVRPANQVVGVLVAAGDWDVTIVGVGSTSPSRYFGFFAGPTPPNGANFWFVKNQEYSTLANQASQQVTIDACKQWNDAERALHQQVDLLPVTFLVTGWYGKNVKFTPYSDSGIWPTTLQRT